MLFRSESMTVGLHRIENPHPLSLMTKSQGYPMDGSTDQRWKIGEGFMHLENLFLVRFVSVSKGSFQPEIWVVDSLT